MPAYAPTGSLTVSDPFRVAVTLDVDPDANRAVAGRVDAVSPPVQAGQARFDAVEAGLRDALAILASLDVAATLFFESRTAVELAERGLDLRQLCRGHEVACHGRRHEDLLGTVSGLPLSPSQIRDMLADSRDAIEQVTGARPVGFRAPYTRVDDTVLSVLSDLGFAYDSSITREACASWRMEPYRVAEGLWEVPLPSLRDSNHKLMSCYLWPFFEGRRASDEYVAAAADVARRFPGGIFQLALHPWHILIDEDGQRFSAAEAGRNRTALAEVLSRLAGLDGVTFTTLRACLPDRPPPAVTR